MVDSQKKKDRSKTKQNEDNSSQRTFNNNKNGKSVRGEPIVRVYRDQKVVQTLTEFYQGS